METVSAGLRRGAWWPRGLSSSQLPSGDLAAGGAQRGDCRPGSCPHRGVPCGCVWPVTSHLFTATEPLPVHAVWWEPVTTAPSPLPASLPTAVVRSGFPPTVLLPPSPPPALPSVKAARGSASHFQDFKKPKGKAYIYLNEAPRLNKTLSVFALGWSLSTQCGISTDQKH